jgi:hypothetical protein
MARLQCLQLLHGPDALEHGEELRQGLHVRRQHGAHFEVVQLR